MERRGVTVDTALRLGRDLRVAELDEVLQTVVMAIPV